MTLATQAARHALGLVGAAVSGINLLVAAAWLWWSPPEGQAQQGLVVASACVGAGALGTSTTSRRWLVWLRGTAVVAVSVAYAVVQMSSDLRGWWPQFELAALSALVVLALQPKVWVALTAPLLLLAGFASVPLLRAGPEYVALSPVVAAAPIVRVLAVTIAFAIAGRMLLRGAAAVDRSITETLATEREVVFARERVLAERRARRLAHDTALNTLEAVARGLPAEQAPRFAARAIADADALASIGKHQDGSVESVTAALHARAAHLGVELLGRVADPESVEPGVEALVAAAGEVLLNAGKHAGTTRVHLEPLAGPAFGIKLTDHGRGFDTRAAAGLGLRESITARMAEVGGTAHIRSAPGQGTQVALRLPPRSEPETRASLSERLRPAMARLAGLGGVVAALGILADTAGLQRACLALALVALATLTSVWAARQPELGGPEVTIVASVLALVQVLTPLADPYCSSWLRVSGFPDNRLLLVVVVAVLCRRLMLTVALTCVYVGFGYAAVALSALLWPLCEFASAVTAWAGLGIIGGAVTLGIVTRRQEQQLIDAERRELLAVRELADAEALSAVERRWRNPAAARAVRFLRGLAGSPSAALADPATRRRASRMASDVRAVVLVAGASPANLARGLVALQDWCLDHDLPLAVSGDPADVDRDAPDWFPGACARMSRGVSAVHVTVSRTHLWQTVLVRLCGITEPWPPVSEAETWVDEDGSWLRLVLAEGAGSVAAQGS